MASPWSWRDDLELFFGVRPPQHLSLDQWVTSLREKPCTNALALVGLSAALFYHLEKGRNAKVKDFWDALVYTSTCISVGYGDIFARTPAGKVLGSALMTLGPALAAQTLDGPRRRQESAIDEEMLRTLKQILAVLEGGGAKAIGEQEPEPR